MYGPPPNQLIGAVFGHKERKLIMDELALIEFRTLYRDIFKGSATVEETPEVKSHPGYKRYQQLAPAFYTMMLRKRRELDLIR